MHYVLPRALEGSKRSVLGFRASVGFSCARHRIHTREHPFSDPARGSMFLAQRISFSPSSHREALSQIASSSGGLGLKLLFENACNVHDGHMDRAVVTQARALLESIMLRYSFPNVFAVRDCVFV
eukprot:3912948-Rhodomonas_salina.1